MRSFATAALCLALLHTSDARVPHSFRDLMQRETQPEPRPQGGIIEWFSRLFKRSLQPRQDDDTCYEDDYYVFVGSPSLGEGFCQDYMDYPNQTVPVEATATSTLTTTYTTDVDTITEYTRVTPAATLTETVTAGSPKVKRNGHAQITARAVLNRKEAFQLFRRQVNATADDSEMADAFSSACDCHDYNGPVVSSTYTGQTTVRTLRAFGNVDTTVTQTQTAAASIATTTTTTVSPPPAEPLISPVSSTSSQPAQGPSTTDSNPSNPTPTAPAFTCPDNHNTTVSQMVGSERFDYLVLCDTVLVDADIYGGVLSYKSFSECVGACSIADQQFDNPVCQGVSFYATDAAGSGNCFLKGAANHTVLADGVDSAILQRILVGVTNDTMQATATESLPFAGAQTTADPAQMSSMMASVLANSSNVMPMVTPINPPPVSGRQVGPITAYSTYVSDGSTYSSGTGYTIATTFANGSWYSAYYTSYTMTWASVATVYAQGAGGNDFENSTTSSSSQTNGANGQYGIITTWNTTYQNGSTQDVVQTISYEANGTPFFSTATTTFTAATGAAGGGAGGAGGSAPASAPAGPLITPSIGSTNGSANGGDAGGAAGGPGSGGPSPVTSTSTFSTQTLITLPGGSTGFAQSGYAAGGLPVTYTRVSTLVTNGSTAYQTYYEVSGSPSGTGGASSAIISGGPSSTPTPSVVTVVSSGGQTAGGSGGIISGGPGNTGAASSLIISGGPSSSPSPSILPVPTSLSIVTIISNGGATNGGTGGIISGGPTGTGGGSSGFTAGGPSSLPTSNTTSLRTATFTGAPRSPGEESSSTSAPILTAPTGVYSPPESPSGPLPGTVPSSNGTVPPGTSPLTATFTGVPRSPGSESSTSIPLFTAPTGGVYSPPVFTAPTGTSRPTASFTGDNRSGDYSGSSSTPLGTAPPGTAPSGTAPPGTAPSGTLQGTYGAPAAPRYGDFSSSAPGTAPPGTAPSGTAPSGTAPGTAPPGTAPSGTAPGTAPPGTSPGTYSAPGAPRYGDYSSSAPGTGPAPSGSQPIGTGPAPSGSLPVLTAPAPSGSPPIGTGPSYGLPLPTTPTPTGLIPTGTSPASFSNSGNPRSPGSESSTGTAPHPYPSMTFPTAQSSCANGTMGTTTLFSTTTVYGCYSTCLPSWGGPGGWGGYGGPHAFGTGAPPAETSS